MDKFDMTL